MAGGRTVWMGIDVAFMRRERNITLALEAGPDAWGVLFDLWLEAKEQRSTDGTVKFGYVSVGQRIGMAPGRVREVVQAAVEIGVLTDFREEGRVCEAVVTDFAKDDRRGREAIRKRDQRSGTQRDTAGQNEEISRHDGDQHSGTDRDNEGHVPFGPPRVEESRGEKRTTPPNPPEGGDEGGGAARSASKGVDADELPDGLTPEQRVAALAVQAELERTHAESCPSAKPPTLRQTGKAVAAHPTVDHLAVAAELDHWAVQPSRTIRDLAGTYRTFVKRRAADDERALAADERIDAAQSAWDRREQRRREKCRAEGVCANCVEARPARGSDYCSACLKAAA